ncbi:MAG: hypothetical protein GY913_35500, partial [Proteobacteria bacterium]|nr:hypothetical protein [Pseudomonadota bacterium]
MAPDRPAAKADCMTAGFRSSRPDTDTECAEAVEVDRHDPAVIPYPGGETKLYVEKKALLDTGWHVGYSTDGVNYEDWSFAHFYFDNGSGVIDTSDPVEAHCIDDPAALTWKQG